MDPPAELDATWPRDLPRRSLHALRQWALNTPFRRFIPMVIEGDSYRIRSDFCPSTVQTLATRRVLIAPRGMTSADAFLLTRAAASALLPVPTDSDLTQPLEVAKGLRF